MAKTNLRFLWEAFALASGIPPSTWQAVPGHNVAVVQSDKNRLTPMNQINEAQIKEVMPKDEYRMRPPLHGHVSGRK